jgi:hypothetical protein
VVEDPEVEEEELPPPPPHPNRIVPEAIEIKISQRVFFMLTPT